MPISHQVQADLQLIVSIHVGDVDDDEFLQSYKDLFESSEFDLRHNRLVDLRHANSGARSSAALQTFAEFMRRHYRGSRAAPKTAVIAPHDVSFGLARMYEALVDIVPGEFAVFRSADEALAWLGVPPDVCATLEFASAQPEA